MKKGPSSFKKRLSSYKSGVNEFRLLAKAPLIKYSGKKVVLPDDIVNKIESHWENLINDGKYFWRGDVFTITNIKDDSSGIQISVALTDYAHYLATLHEIIDKKYACRVVHSSIVLETSDEYLIFGEMGEDTALSGRIQCIGGGITRGDLTENGLFINIGKNASTEMAEEVGLFVNNKDHIHKFYPWAIIESGPQKVIGIVHWARTPMNLNEFTVHYAKFEKIILEKGDVPEFSRVINVFRRLKNKKEWLNGMGRKFADHLLIIFDNLQ
ncbi:MAG: NUDIX hydrolase [Candidatus Moranbacteria bacterium GW2011_GWF2_34_56]|nr:MAG: NUDIX hydrolase [Candidatus Moranbacteria bacterium GW2011_GWF1_34_10]KKP65370.1 MAG: NUDIX hydrolase [Candidatus Moranbacteria bacterium GW2011_GWF2_34_56]HBI17438.1 hypothetical protein [Candidatus Moranbacteria bacterium]